MLAGNETGSFTGFTFTEPGDYVYTVRQTPGETEYMTYDDAVYTVVIQVTNAEDGGLTYQIFASEDQNPDEKAAAVRFLNTYAPPPKAHPDAWTERHARTERHAWAKAEHLGQAPTPGPSGTPGAEWDAGPDPQTDPGKDPHPERRPAAE